MYKSVNPSAILLPASGAYSLSAKIMIDRTERLRDGVTITISQLLPQT